MKNIVYDALEAANVAVNQASEIFDIRYNYGYAVQATFTGSPSGTVLVEGSIDKVNWSTISTLTISGLTVQADNKDGIYWPYIRVSKASGGTGTVSVKLSVKGA